MNCLVKNWDYSQSLEVGDSVQPQVDTVLSVSTCEALITVMPLKLDWLSWAFLHFCVIKLFPTVEVRSVTSLESPLKRSPQRALLSHSVECRVASLLRHCGCGFVCVGFISQEKLQGRGNFMDKNTWLALLRSRTNAHYLHSKLWNYFSEKWSLMDS